MKVASLPPKQPPVSARNWPTTAARFCDVMLAGLGSPGDSVVKMLEHMVTRTGICAMDGTQSVGHLSHHGQLCMSCSEAWHAFAQRREAAPHQGFFVFAEHVPGVSPHNCFARADAEAQKRGLTQGEAEH